MAFVTRTFTYTTSEDGHSLISKKRRMYGTIRRNAFQYVFDNEFYKSDKETWADTVAYIKSLFATNDVIDISFLENAVREGFGDGISELERRDYLNELHESYNKSRKAWEADKFVFKPRIHGTRKKFKQLCNKEITREEWDEARLSSINFDGRANENGNRKADFLFNENKINIKFSRKEHVLLDVSIRGYKEELKILQEMVDDNLIPISWNIISSNKIQLTYDVAKVNAYKRNKGAVFTRNELLDFYTVKNIKTRHGAIDANPDKIGVCIRDDNQVIFTDAYDLKELVDMKYKSYGAEKETVTNIFNTRLEKIAILIVRRLSHYKVDQLFMEELNFKQGDQGKGSHFNNIMSNWPYDYFLQLMKKHCENAGIRLKTLNAAYSSFVGNILYDYFDPISAACELARRGYTKQFYPDLIDIDVLANRWKEHPKLIDIKNCKSWVDLPFHVPLNGCNIDHCSF